MLLMFSASPSTQKQQSHVMSNSNLWCIFPKNCFEVALSKPWTCVQVRNNSKTLEKQFEEKKVKKNSKLKAKVKVKEENLVKILFLDVDGVLRANGSELDVLSKKMLLFPSSSPSISPSLSRSKTVANWLEKRLSSFSFGGSLPGPLPPAPAMYLVSVIGFLNDVKASRNNR